MKYINNSDPNEKDLWQKLKSAEMKSNSVNISGLTREINRQEKIGFFPSNFVRRLEISEIEEKKKLEIKKNEEESSESSESSEESAESDTEMNSAFNNMKSAKTENQMVKNILKYYLFKIK